MKHWPYIALSILGVSPLIFAEEGARWTPLGTGTGMEIYLDSQTIDRSDGIVKAWVKYVYDGEYGKYEPAINGNIKKMIQREEYHCKLGRSAVLSYTAYNKAGNVVASNVNDDPQFNEPTPESVAEMLTSVVCK